MIYPLGITTITTCTTHLLCDQYPSCGAYLPCRLQPALSSYDIWACQACKDTTNSSANCNALVDLFDCIDNILKRLKIDPEVTVTQGMTQILVKIMMELLSVLALATKEVNEGLFSEFILASKSPFNATLLREIWKETTGRKRHSGDPTEAGSAYSRGGSEDGHAYS